MKTAVETAAKPELTRHLKLVFQALERHQPPVISEISKPAFIQRLPNPLFIISTPICDASSRAETTIAFEVITPDCDEILLGSR